MTPERYREESIDVWGEEGGMVLSLRRRLGGKVVFTVTAMVGGELQTLASVTVAQFRTRRISAFLMPPMSEEEYQATAKMIRDAFQGNPGSQSGTEAQS